MASTNNCERLATITVDEVLRPLFEMPRGIYQRHNTVVDLLCEWAGQAGTSSERSVSVEGR